MSHNVFEKNNGYRFGFYTKIKLIKSLFIQPEIFYSSIKKKYDLTFPLDHENFVVDEFKQNRIIFPVLLGIDLFDRFSRRIKYLLSIILLIREILKDREILVFSFQANLYCIAICKLFSVKVISRSNSAPIGWSKNFLKKLSKKSIRVLGFPKKLVRNY